MMYTNKEIIDRFNAMRGNTEDKIEVLASITMTPKKVIREIIRDQDKIETNDTDKMAADLAFEPGTAIYKLIEERLDTLEHIIKSATKEYEELAGYLKNGQT